MLLHTQRQRAAVGCAHNDMDLATTFPSVLLPYLASMPSGKLRLTREPAGVSTETQTARTITRMDGMATKSAATQAVGRAVADALRNLPPDATPADRASRIFGWVQRHVIFRDDPAEDEFVIEPDLLLAMPQPMGDCDDFATLTAAMLERTGIPWEFVTIAADRAAPNRLSHVYVQAYVPAPANNADWTS